jgi:hypothetical protein
LFLAGVACCEAEEVADEMRAVDVALSSEDVTAVDDAVVVAGSASAAALDAAEEGVEFAESDRAFTGSASVDVELIDVAVNAATIPVLKTKTVRLVTRTLAIENAMTLFFIPRSQAFILNLGNNGGPELMRLLRLKQAQKMKQCPDSALLNSEG